MGGHSGSRTPLVLNPANGSPGVSLRSTSGYPLASLRDGSFRSSFGEAIPLEMSKNQNSFIRLAGPFRILTLVLRAKVPPIFSLVRRIQNENVVACATRSAGRGAPDRRGFVRELVATHAAKIESHCHVSDGMIQEGSP